jgi:ATP-dependent DNA helicase RecG
LIEEQKDELRIGNYELWEEEKKSVTKVYEKLRREIFPDLRIAMLHGRMKSKEKDQILADFAAKEYDILISTSVIEVGIDIPNASVMMIEDAERFGLAQVHQFRGRVGRGEHQSFCFLFSNSQSLQALHRLKSLEAVSDGFKLAEIDLETRGPGDLFGTLQSGQLELKMASISDRILIDKASRAAEKVLAKDPTLANNEKLRQKVREFELTRHFE